MEASCVSLCSYEYLASDIDIPWYSLVQLSSDTSSVYVSMLENTVKYILKLNTSTGSIQKRIEISGLAANSYLPFAEKFISSSIYAMIYMNQDGLQVLFINVEDSDLEIYAYSQVMEHSVFFAISQIFDGGNTLYLGGYNAEDQAQIIQSDYQYLHSIGEIFAETEDSISASSVSGSTLSLSSYSHTYSAKNTYNCDSVTGAYVSSTTSVLAINTDTNFTYFQRANIYDTELIFDLDNSETEADPLTYI